MVMLMLMVMHCRCVRCVAGGLDGENISARVHTLTL